MVYCRFCKKSYDEQCLNETRLHDLNCDPKKRVQYYNHALGDLQSQQKELEDQLRGLDSSMGNLKRHSNVPEEIHNESCVNLLHKRQKIDTIEIIENSSMKLRSSASAVSTKEVDNGTILVTEDNGEVSVLHSTEPPTSNEMNLNQSNTAEVHNPTAVFEGGEDGMINEYISVSAEEENFESDSHTLRNLLEQKAHQIQYYTDLERRCLELANILREVKAPLHTYDKILKWSKSCADVPMDFAPTYKTLIRKMSERCGLNGIFPKNINVSLPSGNQIKVTKFSFVSNLFSLLSNEILMKPENLIFGNDPFKRVPEHGPDHIYDDIETTNWYLKTQKSYCTSINNVIVPMIFFIDKTQVKAKNIEPISFTLGIFRRHVRRKPMAWRNFGLIPGKIGDSESSEKALKSNKTSLNRLRDWHKICEVLLQDFKKMQAHKDGIECYILGKLCRIKLPIMFIIGDIEGHDKLCTRKASHGKLTKGVTHSCNVQRDVCGNPGQTCEPFLSHEIFHLQQQTLDPSIDKETKKAAVESLHEKGFHSFIKNSYFELDYGDSLGGLHSAVAVCLMHTFKQRFPGDVVEVAFNLFGTTTDSTPSHMINRAITRLVPFCTKQSDRSFPIEISGFDLSFLNSKYTLSANEKYARLFPLLWFFYTTGGRKYVLEKRNNFYDESHVRSIHKLIELTISIHQFLSQDEVRRYDLPNAKLSIVKFQQLYKSVSEVRKAFLDSRNDFGARKQSPVAKGVAGNRNKRNEPTRISNAYDNPCQFPKFHYMGHTLPQVELYGSTNNFNADQCESNHKDLSKATGLRTQGRSSTFDMQTSKRFAENLVLERTLISSRLMDKPFFASVHETKSFEFVGVHKHSAGFTVHLSNTGSIIAEWKGSHSYPVDDNLKDFLEKNVFKQKVQYKNRRQPSYKVILKDKVLNCYTTMDFGNCIMRAHPCYREKPWYDYAMVQWHGTKQQCNYYFQCPAKIICFVHIDGHPNITYPTGYYAIIHSTEFDEVKQRPSEIAHKKWKTLGSSPVVRVWTFEKNLSIVHIGCIKGPCYMFPDFDDMDFKVPSKKFIFQARALKEWGKCHGRDGLSWRVS